MLLINLTFLILERARIMPFSSITKRGKSALTSLLNYGESLLGLVSWKNIENNAEVKANNPELTM
jgi:hypothetical protein